MPRLCGWLLAMMRKALKIRLHIRSDLRTGTQFALASQCGSAIGPMRESALARKTGFLDADDILTLIKVFPGCSTKNGSGPTRPRLSFMIDGRQRLPGQMGL